MRLVDTSAWVEWLGRTPTARLLRAELPQRPDWLVPTIVQLELSKWLTRSESPQQVNRVLAFTTACVVCPLDMRLAMAAAEVAGRHKLSAADAIIYATARAFGADLLTCDAHLQNISGVVLVPKLTV